MPGPWSDATDRQLLLTIIHLSAPQLPSWAKVAELMGDGFTAESTRQHFQKLRKDSKAQFGELDGNEKQSTPSKSKASVAKGDTPSKSTGKRKAIAKAQVEEDNIVVGTPSKKAIKREDDHESN